MPAATTMNYLWAGMILQFSSGSCNYSHRICTVRHEPRFIFLLSSSSQYSPCLTSLSTTSLRFLYKFVHFLFFLNSTFSRITSSNKWQHFLSIRFLSIGFFVNWLRSRWNKRFSSVWSATQLRCYIIINS